MRFGLSNWASLVLVVAVLGHGDDARADPSAAEPAGYDDARDAPFTEESDPGEEPIPTAAPDPQASLEPSRVVSYRYSVGIDAPITVAAIAIGVGTTFFGHETRGPVVGSVDDVYVLDRGVARRATTRAAARTASDVVLISSVGLAGIATWFSVDRHQDARRGRVLRRERFRRIGVFLETLATANALNSMVKLGARRPRPFTYAASYDPSEGRLDDQLSYYSGHTSTVAAAASAAAYFALAGDGHRHRRAAGYAVLGVGTAATASVALLRVRAGRHFPTDVITGALVGGAIGILVPHLHYRTRATGRAENAALAFDVAPLPGGGLVSLAGQL